MPVSRNRKDHKKRVKKYHDRKRAKENEMQRELAKILEQRQKNMEEDNKNEENNKDDE